MTFRFTRTCVIGIVHWCGARSEVCFRRNRWGRGGVGSTRLREGKARQVWVLPPRATLVVDGDRGTLAARRRRWERTVGEGLFVSELTTRRGREVAVWARRSALRAVPEGSSAIPAPLALAALTRVAAPRRRIGFFWEGGGVCIRGCARSGRLVPGLDHGLPWLLLASLSPNEEAWFRSLEPGRIFTPEDIGLGSLAPCEVLAVGGALAVGQKGAFPPPGRSLRSWAVGGTRRSLPWALLLVSGIGWFHGEGQLRRREHLRERLQKKLERYLVERRPGLGRFGPRGLEMERAAKRP